MEGFSAGFKRMLGRGKILLDTGHLRGSITYKASRTGVRVGTNVVYGRIHQLGGKAGRGKKVKIPARPYLVVHDADRRYIGTAITQYIAGERGRI